MRRNPTILNIVCLLILNFEKGRRIKDFVLAIKEFYNKYLLQHKIFSYCLISDVSIFDTCMEQGEYIQGQK